jgi:hypothetical protein
MFWRDVDAPPSPGVSFYQPTVMTKGWSFRTGVLWTMTVDLQALISIVVWNEANSKRFRFFFSSLDRNEDEPLVVLSHPSRHEWLSLSNCQLPCSV